MRKDFINIRDFTPSQLQSLLDRSIADKELFRRGQLEATLERKVLAMVFEKPSLRTRVSFETAMTHLGGHAIYMTQADIGLGSREPAKDVARVLGRMCDAIMARTFSHEMVEELARFSPVPVVNALTDYSHPCQAMADLMTARERFGELAGRTLTFVGDGNNVARSLAALVAKLGMKFVLACPPGYGLEESYLETVRADYGSADGCRVTHDPRDAVADADVIYTDTWVSMGQESERLKRQKDLSAFQINGELLALAPPHAIVMHCLPAYRGYEISDEAFEAHAETILDESENRLHFQRTLLNVLVGDGGIA